LLHRAPFGNAHILAGRRPHLRRPCLHRGS
jgi:hypothetical protein